MSKGPSTFRKADTTRGVDAIRKAGLRIARVQIDRSGKLEFALSDGNSDAGEESCDPPSPDASSL
jgi:hypothetical protein